MDTRTSGEWSRLAGVVGLLLDDLDQDPKVVTRRKDVTEDTAKDTRLIFTDSAEIETSQKLVRDMTDWAAGTQWSDDLLK